MNSSNTSDCPRFWLQVRAWGLVTLCLSSSSSAVQIPSKPAPGTSKLTYQGVLSAIDIGARPGAAGEIGRTPGLVTTLGGQEVTPLVELIHMQNLLACRAATGAAKTGCKPYEWSVPFIPEANARALEQELSLAWNDFDAKSTWYMNSLLNAKPDPGLLTGVIDALPKADWEQAQVALKRLLPATQGRSLSGNCSANAKAPADRYLGAWSGKDLASIIDTKLFCADVLKAVQSALPSYVPGRSCMELPAATDWGEVGRRLTQGYGQAIGEYYPQYWLRVYAAIERYMPGSLAWDGVYPLSGAVGTQGGVQLQPIYAAGPQPAQYQALTSKAQAKVPGADSYLLQRYPYPDQLGLSLPSAAPQLKVPSATPNAGLGSSWPGIPKLEVLKYNLANREDIFARADQWWSKAAAPRGRSGAGDLRETEGFGAVSFIQLYSQVDKLSSPRSVEYNRWCFVGSGIPVPVLVKLGYPNIASGINSLLGGLTRVHVRYESAPEGYPLHHVSGQPSRNIGTFQAALSVRLPSIAGLPKIDALKWPSTQTLIREAASKVAAPSKLTALAPTKPTPAAKPAPRTEFVTPRTPQELAAIERVKRVNQTKTAPVTKPQAQPKANKSPENGCEEIRKNEILRMCLANKILGNPRITLGTSSSTGGGSPLNNVRSAAINQTSARGCGSKIPNCGQRVYLSTTLLTAMLKMASNGSRYTVTAITGGGHGGATGSSYHYTGQAFDIGSWTDASSKKSYFLGTPNTGHKLASQGCLDAGSSGTLNAYTDKDHQDHVHCNFR